MASIFAPQLQAIDDQSAALVLELQLQDISSIFLAHKGKGAEGSVNDRDYALQLCKQELEESLQILNDRKMGRSIANAVQSDRHVLAEVFDAEDVATKDRELAVELSGHDTTPVASSCDSPKEETTIHMENMAKLAALYNSERDGMDLLFEDGRPQLGESSSRGGKGKQKQRAIDRRCEVCREVKRFFDVARLPCDHEYCRDCLDQLFKTSITDEAFFPPRCCRRPISPPSVRMFLTAETYKEFERKKIEYGTPNRTYCSASRCSAFIHPRNIRGEVASCSVCGTRTCTTCKLAAHTGDCPNDEALQELLRTAVTNRWQRCHHCWRVVELQYGCYHITCHCGAQFCYLCGQRWKTCRCQDWDQHRLLARAEQIVDREPTIRAFGDNEEDEIIEAPTPPPQEEPIHPRLHRQHLPLDPNRLIGSAREEEHAPHLWPQLPDLGPAQEMDPFMGGTNEGELLPAFFEERPMPGVVSHVTTPVAISRSPSPPSSPLRPWPSSPPAEASRALREPPADLSPETLRVRAIADVMRQLVENHECDHNRWRFIQGRHECEECADTLPLFIFECRQCRIRACNRCRRNRLGRAMSVDATGDF